MVATRTASHGEKTVEDIREAGGEAALMAIDIGELANVNKVVQDTVDRWGGVDIMVHNAASFLGGPVEAYSEDDLETVQAVNLKACFRLSAACIPHFRKRGGGRLLFTSLVTGPRVAMPGTSYYAASKSGITGYIGASEDIACAMLFLASDQARYITGQTLCIDGGSTLPESPVFLMLAGAALRRCCAPRSDNLPCCGCCWASSQPLPTLLEPACTRGFTSSPQATCWA